MFRLDLFHFMALYDDVWISQPSAIGVEKAIPTSAMSTYFDIDLSISNDIFL